MNDSSSSRSSGHSVGTSFQAICSKVSLITARARSCYNSELCSALGYFNWVCWIAPENVVVNQLFGYTSGLGMSLITFDWSQIAYIGSPLASPWWAEANVAVGFVTFFCG